MGALAAGLRRALRCMCLDPADGLRIAHSQNAGAFHAHAAALLRGTSSACGFSSTSTTALDPRPSPPAAGVAAADATALDATAEFLKVLLHPISRGAKYNGQLSPFMHNIEGRFFLDPRHTLRSTMRALHVIQSVLEDDGHVYVVNSNPLMRPLMAEAARSCVNPNVWFYWDKWVPGTLTNVQHTKRLLQPQHQPNRRLFAKKGLRMSNFHCRPSQQLATTPHAMPWQDRWRLYDLGQEAKSVRQLLQGLMTGEAAAGASPVPGAPQDKHAAIRLFVVLDSTINYQALVEAQQKQIMTIGLVNHHKDLSPITFPVFARDNHPQFQHFFVNWLLRVVNTPPVHVARPVQ